MIKFAPKSDEPRSAPRRSVIECLSDTMREMAFADENITPETLAPRGYSPDLVRRIGRQAAELARRRSIRRI
ncbi:hypothetical protein [Mesorhizobium sp. RMAD-H1]|uniref:hypothetical protein n=1 Tax=Mesorhizobium sp. RMAD-H1 TaxID=2587065 RepID=UPI00161F5B0B|nr:hypothetical protein [Mesorhizobium sp. RMAD-H1]MBB2973981.1 hypothetical protein [Mesorhizobium sp. RMAD-H1]